MRMIQRLVTLSATISTIVFAMACGRGESSSDAARFQQSLATARQQQEIEQRPQVERLVRAADELWRQGNRDAAVEMYASIREFDPGHAYAKFGLGLQTARNPPAGDASINPWGTSKALLTAYLASRVDLGSGAEAERRSMAKTTLGEVHAKFIERSGEGVPNPNSRPETSAAPRISSTAVAAGASTREIGTFTNTEGSGSSVTVSLIPGKRFEVRQGSDTVAGIYEPMNLPFPERADGNVYFDLQGTMVNGKTEKLGSIVCFYSTKSDSLFLVDGRGAKERLLSRGRHPELATELKRVK